MKLYNPFRSLKKRDYALWALSLVTVLSANAACGSPRPLVLILLWIIAAVRDLSQAPMIACFAAFLLNDTYAFFSWRKREKAQKQT